ncbi:hypothetical protein BGZ63DRAFT_350547, partial [Mariannaea sp. PMI_226]
SRLLPLASVISPATLSVRASIQSELVTTSVPTVDFSNGTDWSTYEGLGRIETPSFEINRLFAAVFSSANFLPLSARFPNSSYDMNFWAPSYKCQSLKEIVARNNKPTWDTNIYNYNSIQAVWDAFIKPQIEDQKGTYYIYTAAAPYFMNNLIMIWAAGVSNERNNSLSGSRIVCQLYNTSYKVSVRFNEGVQSITPLHIQYLNPHAWDSDYGSLGAGHDIETAYVTQLIFSQLLVGNISVGVTVGNLDTNPNPMGLLQSGLIDCPEIWNSTSLQQLAALRYTGLHNCRNRTLARAIEDLSRNFTYSMMVFYSGRGFATTLPVTVRSPRNLYSYDTVNLLMAYGASLFIVLIWVLVGSVTVWNNGITSSTSFSTILLTTRNPDLDKLAEGYSLGSDPLPKEICKTRLKFGCLDDAAETKRAGFGLSRTVTPIQKGENLY